MKSLYLAAALAAASLIAPGAVLSQTTRAETVTLQKWGQRIGDELNRHVRYPTLIGGQPFATGVARVKFNCSESGRPDKVALLRSSGSRALDRAALDAVQHIASLHPLPDGMRHDQKYEAVILFATDQDGYESQLRTIRTEAKKSNAWFKGQSVAAADDRPITIGG